MLSEEYDYGSSEDEDDEDDEGSDDDDVSDDDKQSGKDDLQNELADLLKDQQLHDSNPSGKTRAK